jgi:hypothetical protein
MNQTLFIDCRISQKIADSPNMISAGYTLTNRIEDNKQNGPGEADPFIPRQQGL